MSTEMEKLLDDALAGWQHDKQIPAMVGFPGEVTYISSAGLPCKSDCRSCCAKRRLLPLLEAGEAMWEDTEANGDLRLNWARAKQKAMEGK